MGSACDLSRKKEGPITYVSDGSIVILNFRTLEDSWAKPISLHDGNILKKGIQMFQESIGMTEKRIKKAVYEPNNTELNLTKKIYELDINYASNIVVYFSE